MTSRELPPNLVARRAVVYVRQSTSSQVLENLESQRRQYELKELAASYGFRDISVIDDDLGRSASGSMDRPGFRSLVAQICEGAVGGVFCLEASRLARNGRDWHHLLELCGLVGACVIDGDGVYDPSNPNDRLLLGLKGTMSEFELTLIRKRTVDAVVSKARRGELRLLVPIGYVWSRDTGLTMDPDRRIQDSIRTIFRLFARLGSARRVLSDLLEEQISVPRSADGRTLRKLEWRAPVYRSVIAVLRNPFYAGAYAYGKSQVETSIVEGRIRKTYGRMRPIERWGVLIRDHHEGYISWEQFEENQRRLARNTFRKPAGGAKSGRGGQALLASLLRCRRCGRMLMVYYQAHGLHRYACRMGNLFHGAEPCISFAARRPEEAVTTEILVAVQPLAVEAALVAEREAMMQSDERRRALELERQQAEYEVKLAARRYQAVDPDNRLVASELEARWNAAIARLRECEARLVVDQEHRPPAVDRNALLSLATDLKVVWNAPGTDMRTKQRILRALVEEIVVDVDEQSREIILVIHWRGGQHSELRVRKTERGHHERRASVETGELIREMATRWSDAEIAMTLNRLGMGTGHGNTWNRKRVASYRREAGIPGPDESARRLTMIEAAKKLGVTNHIVRALIKNGILPATQVTAHAPWLIDAEHLELPEVVHALRSGRTRRGRPCRNSRDDRTLVIPGT